MADSPGSLTGATLGRFRVGALLGSGGMGEVYRADDAELRRAVALKVLPASVVGDADRLARFIQEARTASALNHPHLVAIYDIGQASPDGAAQPVHYIAMELVRPPRAAPAGRFAGDRCHARRGRAADVGQAVARSGGRGRRHAGRGGRVGVAAAR